MDAIYQRVSVRQYTDEPVREEDLREALRAAMAAPSAGNQQPWEFVVVRDEATRLALSQASKYARPAAAAPVVVVFCLRDEGVRFPTMVQQDLGACIENFLLSVASRGLGAVWMGIYPEEERVARVAEALGSPAGLTPFALVSVGHPTGEPHPKGATRFDEERIHWQ